MIPVSTQSIEANTSSVLEMLHIPGIIFIVPEAGITGSVGAKVGEKVGEKVGDSVSPSIVGISVGENVGAPVGARVLFVVGLAVGAKDNGGKSWISKVPFNSPEKVSSIAN
mmetsp:Transcript_9802/g.11174  ORF Transcript_9802/g.11174 Transcript_9802/m.11174 type:complete len:111 (-) Transcript_9802:405-737(-)